MELNQRQAAYINWCKYPPKFYCNKYTNAEIPPENDKGWYCTKQCEGCKREHKNKMKQ